MKIVSDIGNVFIRTDIQKICNDILYIDKQNDSSLDLKFDDVYNAFVSIQKYQDLGLEPFMDLFGKHLQIKSKDILHQIKDIWNNCIELDDESLYAIHHSKHKFIFISNMGHDHKKHLFESMEKHKYGKKILENSTFYFSCDFNLRKPSPAFFQSVMMLEGDLKDCFFIDDIKENLESAKLCGLKPIYFNLLDNINKLTDILNHIENSIKG